MKRSIVPAAFSFLLIIGASPPEAFAFDASAKPAISVDPGGTPDVNAGVDLSRLHGNRSYVESLSKVVDQLSNLRSAVGDVLGDTPDLVDFGFQTGTRSLIVYWSGDPQASVLDDIAQPASDRGLGLVIALRKTSRAQLDAAEAEVAANLPTYRKNGIDVQAYGGFSADFDGLKMTVNGKPSASKLQPDVAQSLQSAASVPVSITYADMRPAGGKYDDGPPFYAGGLMVGTGGKICTNGFGVVYGASVYRFLSARHCTATPYKTETGTYSYGSIVQAGTGTNGAAVFSGKGSEYVFNGSYVGNPTTTRLLTQRDPNLNTVGTPVCQEGGNSGERCGTIRQIALNWDDGYGSAIKINYVTSGSSAIIAASGDSGGPVISLHTEGRAWAVGILQAIQNSTETGCNIRYPSGNACADNFFFTNVDVALVGLTSYGIDYY
ncbi:hypothetical protein GCM10010112_13040 [Actinoplanes lobatus]|uniref:Uncharacterized protein n=1 Tax=Actinoplanes lobatus TaxID=113568 RepID=A0A7W7HMR8_9ACTN|nr:hypothetical protein [Actinoplanes lobatus]MBB4753142.1 hypothetical protein [Actinoplanes lobatus]GGN58856.1 hypothetical protein GCM10010112_13040 [Actinoplanes lobatus]GIE42998.1 hypothetical protein Alo02nite_58960 [Actinoplanes lobatus]